MTKAAPEAKLGERHLIVTLEVTCMAFAIGGEHYFGKLKGYSTEKDAKKDTGTSFRSFAVTHPLTAKEAKYLNKKDGTTRFTNHKPGQTSERFWTREQVERYAVQQWKRHFPAALVLNTGGFATCDPQKVLAGPLWFMDEANKLHEEREACGGYEGNEKKATKLYREYRKLTEKLVERQDEPS